MKHLKLYENFENKNFLLNIVKKQALQFNKPEVLAMVIDKGFDLESNKPDLITYCINKGLYDSIKILDPVYHQKLVDETSELDLRNLGLKSIQLNSLTNLTHLYCNLNDLICLKGIEELANLTSLYCNKNNFPSELEAFGNDIPKWQEYHRNN